MSRVHVIFLAACLAAASALLGAQATAQQQPTAIAINTVTATEIAQSMDDEAFKELLVKGSPWTVEWTNTTFNRTGTIGKSFAVDNDGKLSGQFLGNLKGASGTPPAPLKEVVLIKEKKNCINTVNPKGTKSEYCLQGDGTLKGPFSGQTSRGTDYEGYAVAKPAGR